MRVQLLVSTLVVLLLPPALNAELETLDLERRCGQCHDISDPDTLAGGEDWLKKLADMGPLDQLTPAQRVEVVEFLRYHGWEVNQIVSMATERHLFEEKCGLCHSVQRTFVETMNDEQLRATVERMRQREPQWISEDEAQRIISYIRSGARGAQRPEHRIVDGTPADAFRARCAGCHPLERSYLYLESHLDPQWPLLVKRMQAKAPEWISDSEAQLIVEYLAAQKPVLRPATR